MLKPNDPAPNFALPDLGGDTLSLSDFRDRRVILFNFSSW